MEVLKDNCESHSETIDNDFIELKINLSEDAKNEFSKTQSEINDTIEQTKLDTTKEIIEKPEMVKIDKDVEKSGKNSRVIWMHDITENDKAIDLKQYFTKFGIVDSVKIVTDGDRYYGYIVMHTRNDLDNCMTLSRDLRYKNRTVNLQLTAPKNLSTPSKREHERVVPPKDRKRRSITPNRRAQDGEWAKIKMELERQQKEREKYRRKDRELYEKQMRLKEERRRLEIEKDLFEKQRQQVLRMDYLQKKLERENLEVEEMKLKLRKALVQKELNNKSAVRFPSKDRSENKSKTSRYSSSPTTSKRYKRYQEDKTKDEYKGRKIFDRRDSSRKHHHGKTYEGGSRGDYATKETFTQRRQEKSPIPSFHSKGFTRGTTSGARFAGQETTVPPTSNTGIHHHVNYPTTNFGSSVYPPPTYYYPPPPNISSDCMRKY